MYLSIFITLYDPNFKEPSFEITQTVQCAHPFSKKEKKTIPSMIPRGTTDYQHTWQPITTNVGIQIILVHNTKLDYQI